MNEKTENLDNIAIELPEYPEDIKELFKQTSEFISHLPLSNKQNDELVHLMVENVTRARENGFALGLGVTLENSDIKLVNIGNA